MKQFALNEQERSRFAVCPLCLKRVQVRTLGDDQLNLRYVWHFGRDGQACPANECRVEAVN